MQYIFGCINIFSIMEEVKWIKTQTYLALLFWKVIHLYLSMIPTRILYL